MRLRKNKANTLKVSNRGVIRADFHRNKWAYFMFIPVLVWYIVFCYAPMYGAIIAFKDYSPSLGILGSKWVGLKWIKEFVTDYYFLRLLKNTLVISVTSLVVNFPIPIIYALLVNELRSKKYGKLVQTVTSLPHFISLMVICGMIKTFTMDTGIITKIVGALTGDYSNLLNKPGAFVPIYILSGTWQEMGWSAIIYIAALAGVDQELYEASAIDGAGKLRQVFAITLPSIIPTIVVMLILRIGGLLNVGYEKIILLYNEGIYDTADVISSFVYRRGIVQSDWSYSAAVGLFNSVINFILIITANKISNRLTENGLW